MIQVYKKNDLFVIENTITETIYPNLTREETVELLKKFDRDEPKDRCDFAIKEDNISFEYASLDDKDRKIADLEAKLAEEKEYTQQYRKECAKIQTDYYKTKQKLAEKDKEIERLNLEFETQEDWQEKWQKLYDETCNLNQDKISFALEQLEKVKEFFLEQHRDEEMDTDYIITKDAGEIADYILDQIKQLKEGK